MTNDEIDALRAIERQIAKAGRQFNYYAGNHAAKRTPEADKKAEVNAEWSIKLSRAADRLGEIATALETLRAERDEAVELLDTASDLLWEHCEGLAPRIEPIDAFLTRIEGKDT